MQIAILSNQSCSTSTAKTTNTGSRFLHLPFHYYCLHLPLGPETRMCYMLKFKREIESHDCICPVICHFLKNSKVKVGKVKIEKTRIFCTWVQKAKELIDYKKRVVWSTSINPTLVVIQFKKMKSFAINDNNGKCLSSDSPAEWNRFDLEGMCE